MNSTLEDIYQNEIHPDLCIQRRREHRREIVAETLAGLFVFALGVSALVLVQVAYGIW